jgi:hypothetical protein
MSLLLLLFSLLLLSFVMDKVSDASGNRGKATTVNVLVLETLRVIIDASVNVLKLTERICCCCCGGGGGGFSMSSFSFDDAAAAAGLLLCRQYQQFVVDR